MDFCLPFDGRFCTHALREGRAEQKGPALSPCAWASSLVGFLSWMRLGWCRLFGWGGTFFVAERMSIVSIWLHRAKTEQKTLS